MHKIILVSLLVAMAGLQACNKLDHKTKNGHRIAEQLASDSAEQDSEVQLDKDAKWTADASTNGGMKKLQAMVDAFAPSSDVETLKEPLSKEFTLILENCTMQGEAHNQLHIYLIPLKARIDGLDNGAKSETLLELKTYLAGYWNHFKY